VLTQAPGSPHIPDDAIFTGAAAGKPHHPFGVGILPSAAQRIVYVSYPLAQQLAVYSFDTLGQLTFLRAVPNAGKAACWIAINNAGTRLYTSNAISGDISVFDIGTDATNPRQIQTLSITAIAGSANVNGNPWHLSLDPANQFLYVLTPRDLAITPAGQGNTLHVLQVNADGTLTEVSNSLITINVPVGTNPQGMAVL
jgi:6-phosphogluconolactonase (cycloisomerase 2 family)